MLFLRKMMLSCIIGVLFLLLFIPTFICQAGDNAPDACKLISRREIQTILGAAPSGMDRATNFRNATTSVCEGQLGAAALMIRASMRSAQDRENEAAIEQLIIAGGGKVNRVTTEGSACTTIVPAAPMAAEYGYDALCTINSGELEVAVQSESHQLGALIPIDKLRSLVALAAKRVHGQQ